MDFECGVTRPDFFHAVFFFTVLLFHCKGRLIKTSRGSVYSSRANEEIRFCGIVSLFFLLCLKRRCGYDDSRNFSNEMIKTVKSNHVNESEFFPFPEWLEDKSK